MIYIIKIKRLRLKFRVKEKKKKKKKMTYLVETKCRCNFLISFIFNVFFVYLKISVDSNGARTS